MDLDQLITLQRLARQKSFSSTASYLGITQPTVTLRIKKLEEEVGERLVQRIGQHIALTEAGETFLKYVNRTLRIHDAGQKAISDCDSNLPPVLRLASTFGIATYLLPDFFKEWRRKYPNTQITLQSSRKQDVADMVKDGLVDVGLGRNFEIHPTLTPIHLFDDPIQLVVSSRNALAMENRAVPIERLSSESMVVCRSNQQLTQALFLRKGLIPVICARLHNVTAVKEMVARGFGIAILPKSMTSFEQEARLLEILPIHGAEALTLSATAIINEAHRGTIHSGCLLANLFVYEFKVYCRDNLAL